MPYVLDHPIAERAPADARSAFIRRTYAHLAGAILAFVAIEFLIFGVLLPDFQARAAFFQKIFAHPGSWLVLVLAFVGVGWLAEYWAKSGASPAVQYLGLGLYVVTEALIFVPLLWVATDLVKDQSLIPTAGILTLAIFAGLTVTVFTTGRDFSFLGPILSVGFFVALGFIIAACIFGFHLGLIFAFAIIALASGSILYYTSKVLHDYRTDQHVAAALNLFAAVALLFYYILWVLIQVYGRDR